MNEVCIVLPLPPKQLHPNARPHHMAKAKATKRYRANAAAMTLAATRSARPQWPCARCQATFYVRDRRRRDADNALASLKAAFDGVTDGGLLADDHGLSHAPVRFEVDAANPRVELVFSALPAEAPR